MYLNRSSALVLAAVAILFCLGVSGVDPYDRKTWLMEVFPVLVALPVLWATHERFPLTTLLYILIAVHSLILIVGGAYTYARVPIGFEFQDLFDLSRNPYDKLGHFAQGFVPVLIAREILLRGDYIRRGKMLLFVLLSIVLAISAAYELVEWGAALALGQGADEFLGTQGDPWDTQSDMFMALLGGITALALLSPVQDRQLAVMRRDDARDVDTKQHGS